MELSGDYSFSGPRDQVYHLLLDPDVLGNTLPGTERFEKVSENTYEAEMQVSVGPVSGSFEGSVTVKNQNPPESYTLDIEGESSMGFVEGTADITLEEKSENSTTMHYEASMEMGGKLASLGSRMLKPVAQKMSTQSLDEMNSIIEEKLD